MVLPITKHQWDKLRVARYYDPSSITNFQPNFGNSFKDISYVAYQDSDLSQCAFWFELS